MVHALEEIRRILVPAGILIDLRPMAGSWPVQVVSERAQREVGRLIDLPAGLADYKASNRAMKAAARRGLFVCESQECFPFFYYWDTPEEMRQHVQEHWSDFMKLEEESFSATHNAWAATVSDRRVRVQVRMHLARWRKR